MRVHNLLQTAGRSIRLHFLAALCAGACSGAVAADYISVVVPIDQSTTLPVGTGLFGDESGDDLLLLAEGAIRPFHMSTRMGEGWFGPDGQTSLSRTGQVVGNGMPYGALLMGTGSPANMTFAGSFGHKTVQTADLGDEFRLTLNMSAADHAGMEGTIVAKLAYIAEDVVEVDETIIERGSEPIIETGLVATEGDLFVAMAHGLGRAENTTSFFGPHGRIQLRRAGQPTLGAFGALYGRFLDSHEPLFYVGDCGSFEAQPSQEGLTLAYQLNMSDSDFAVWDGVFVVRTYVIKGAVSAVENESTDVSSSLRSFPNPTSGESRIEFSLASGDDVLMRVYDATGRWVRRLVDDSFQPGAHEVTWDGTDDAGQKVASGTYFYQLSTSLGSSTGKVVLTR